MELNDVTDLFANSGFMVFQNTLKAGGVIKCIIVPGCAEYTRKEIDDLTNLAKEQGAKGLATLALTAEGVKGTAQKFVTPEEVAALSEQTGAKEGDLILFVADSRAVANKTLGQLRLLFRDRLDLADQNVDGLCLGGGFPHVRMERGRQKVGRRPSPLHDAQNGRPGQIRYRPRRRSSRMPTIWSATAMRWPRARSGSTAAISSSRSSSCWA